MDINLIGFSGRAGSGKNYSAKMWQAIDMGLDWKETEVLLAKAKDNPSLSGSQWQTKAFAYKLKLITSILTGIPVEELEKESVKKSLLGNEWAQPEYNVLNEIPPFKDIEFLSLITVRDLLDKIGMMMRDEFGEDVWANALFSDWNNQKWLVTDVRFPNEVQFIKERRGICIRLTRNGDKISALRSEIALDNFKDWDYIIDNKKLTIKETFYCLKDIFQRCRNRQA
jgi:hypothetical protein